ncbi:transcriptional regulator, AraC family [Rhizobiales bacterium GAS191]|nr:transcriptional regulator, AraC family [Rhizobiales bacterium GAS113]SED77524.1 transcriptional regulator, AraC family [Rhizobiales bacterium GAS191]
MDRRDVQSSALHNIGAVHVVSHVWSGIHVSDIRVQALPGRAWHPLNSDQPVLSVVVSELNGQCEARLSLSAGNTFRQSGRQRPAGHISLIPANVPVWGYSEHIDQVEEVRLVLDIDRVKEIMGEEFAAAPLQEPRLVFNDESIQALARLVVSSEDKAEWSSLFGDGLVAAMVARLSHLNSLPTRNHRRLGLSTRQLSAVTEYIRDNLANPIRLSELASLADLSLSQFGRAFKTSTGTTPHLWHLDARIETAKRLLTDPRARLAEIALDTGFSEQSHFTRAFRAATGVSPGAWRRDMTN